MRKINLLLIFVLLVLFNVPGLVSAKGGFSSGGGGINMGWLTADFSSINHELISMGLNSVDENISIRGVQGFGYISANFRLGVRLSGGSNRTSAVIPADAINLIPELARDAEVSSGISGLTLEYTRDVPYGIKMIAGGMIGNGHVSVKISQYESLLNWDGIWDDYQSGSGSYNSIMNLSNSFFVFNPWIGAEYKVLNWVGVAVKAGYVFSTSDSGDWMVDGDDIYGGPKVGMSSLNFEFSLNFGR